MRAIRVRRKVEPAIILNLPELAEMLGRTVDIIVLDEDGSGNGTPNLAALDAIAGRGVVDEAAIRELRRVSTI